MIQFEYFNYKLKQNSATKIKQTVGAITPPDGYAFGVLSALTNLETVSSTLITGYNAVFIHTLNSQVPTESAVNAFVTGVASGKVDKTNVAYRLYGTDANGNQTTFPIGVNNLRDVQVDGVSVVDTDGIANIDLTGYLQKTGGTLTGDLAFQYNTNNPKLRIIQSGQNTNHLRFINNNYASQSISFDLSQAAIHPLVTGRGHLGTSDIHFGDAHIDKIYTPIINNGYDISVPVTASAQTLALKSEVDLAANSGDQLTEKGVWYAKMYSATVAPSAEDGTNYADFSQTDGQGNPIIVIYKRQNGAWVQDQTITPPAEYNGYVPVTSKIWDIVEQAGQQGGKVLWSHSQKTFTPSPLIISFEDASLSGTSTAPTPTNSSPNDQIANKEYVDNKASQQGYHPDLFDWKWADHILDDVQWLRADTFSWQPGSTYEPAFWDLFYDIQISTYWYLADVGPAYTKSRTPAVGDAVYLNSNLTGQIGTVATYDDVNDAITVGVHTYTFMSNTFVTPTTETVAGYTLTVYTGHSGKKIVGQVDEADVASIYNATGVAWYYIIDTTNQRFKLPRSNHNKYTTSLSVASNGSYPNFTSFGGDLTNRKLQVFGSDNNRLNLQGSQTGASQLIKFGSESGLVAQQTQETDQYKYLYFYVGNFTQTALENTAGLNAELFNDKVDVGHQVIAFQAPTAGNNYTWYRKYADGWVEQGGLATIPSRTNSGSSSTSITFPVSMSDTNYTGQLSFQSGGAYYSNCMLTIKNRQTTGVDLEFYMNASGTTAAFLVGWEVKGVAAN